MEDKYDITVWSNRLEKKEQKRRECLNSWIGIIPKETQCQICGKAIYFNNANKSQAIHFDHRSGGIETITGSPTCWLSWHMCTAKNRKIWEECRFGMLCDMCNKILPTIGREEFVSRIVKYCD